jgi:hypothetical protein
MWAQRGLSAGLVGVILVACSNSSEATPEPVDSAPIDVQVVAACARLLSCPGAGFLASVSQCILANAGSEMDRDPERLVTGFSPLGDRSSAVRACINDAVADCGKIHFCARGQSGPCAAIPEGGATCEGNRYVFCREGIRNEIDCTTNDCERFINLCDTQPKGKACIVLPDGRAGCGIEPCPNMSLDEAIRSKKCDGNAELYCMAGFWRRYECSPEACGTRPDGTQGCLPLPESPACSPDTPSHCEGLDFVNCSQGSEYRFSCGGHPLPMECAEGVPCGGWSGGSGLCVKCIPSSRLRCNPQVHLDRCRDSLLIYCDGQEREIDCRALGFAGCTESEHGATCLP